MTNPLLNKTPNLFDIDEATRSDVLADLAVRTGPLLGLSYRHISDSTVDTSTGLLDIMNICQTYLHWAYDATEHESELAFLLSVLPQLTGGLFAFDGPEIDPSLYDKSTIDDAMIWTYLDRDAFETSEIYSYIA